MVLIVELRESSNGIKQVQRTRAIYIYLGLSIERLLTDDKAHATRRSVHHEREVTRERTDIAIREIGGGATIEGDMALRPKPQPAAFRERSEANGAPRGQRRQNTRPTAERATLPRSG